MPTIYAGTSDGIILVRASGSPTWASVRDATSGWRAIDNRQNDRSGPSLLSNAGRGGTYILGRTFFAFDTSGISSAPGSAELNIYGYQNGTADVIVVKSSWSGTGLAVGDFDAITGFVAGSSMSGNVTDYSAQITSWSTSGYNAITLNAAAIADMVSQNLLVICVVEYDNDYLNVDPNFANFLHADGCWFSDASQSSTPAPYIVYSSGPAPTVSSISPNAGTANGGTSVTITGANFVATPSVTLGGTAATNESFVSSTEMTATTPAHAAGAVDVVVTNPDAQTGTLSSGYTYVAPGPPVITAINPSRTPAGLVTDPAVTITITGTDFVATPTVQVDWNQWIISNVTFIDSTEITFDVNPITSGAKVVSVWNPDGQQDYVNAGLTFVGPYTQKVCGVFGTGGGAQTIFVADTSGHLRRGTGFWAPIHDDDTADFEYPDGAIASSGFEIAANGTTDTCSATGVIYYIRRYFMAFDISAITETPISATVSFRGGSGWWVAYPQYGWILVKATAPDLVTNIDVTDYNALEGWVSGFDNNDLTAYSANKTDFAGGQWNTFTLNATALADMGDPNQSALKICLLQHDYDYMNHPPWDCPPTFTTAWGDTPMTTFYGGGSTTTYYRPKVDYVMPPDFSKINSLTSSMVYSVNDP